MEAGVGESYSLFPPAVYNGLLSRRETWITAAIALVLIFTSSIWLQTFRALRGRRRIPGPLAWPVLGSVLELRRNFDRVNEWTHSYFSDEVRTFSFVLPGFPRSLKIISTVDPVIVEYILTNLHKYGKVRYVPSLLYFFRIIGM